MKSGLLKKPRILVVTKYFGAWCQPWLWRQTLQLKGFDVQILCWQQHNKDVYSLGAIPIHVLDFDDSPYDGPLRWFYRVLNAYRGNYYASMGQEREHLNQFLHDVRPDLVLCHDCGPALRVLPVAREHGVPTVVYTHGLLYTFNNRWLRWSFENVQRQFKAFIVVSNHQRDWLIRHEVPLERIHVIPCGVPTDVFKPKSHSTASVVRFVTACRLVSEKGIDYIIRAFAELCGTFPTAQLHIFGEGPSQPDLEKLVSKKGLGREVVFHGSVGASELSYRLSEYDVFLEHSLIPEGFGLSICEAMASGLPVIVTPVGGVPDQAVDGQTGLFVCVGDIVGLTESMLRLAKDPELREKMGRAGRQRVVESFGFDKMTHRLEQVLLSLTQGTQDRPLSTKHEY